VIDYQTANLQIQHRTSESALAISNFFASIKIKKIIIIKIDQSSLPSQRFIKDKKERERESESKK